MMQRAALVLLAASLACSEGEPGGAGGCTDNAHCAGGSICQSGACTSLCDTQSDCGQGTICGPDGICVPPTTGARPVIESVLGNDAVDPARVTDGLVVLGRSLETAAFELRDGDGAALVVDVRSRAAERVELVFPPDILSGRYTLVATNQAGSAQAAVTLTLPELGGDEILRRLNEEAAGRLRFERLPVGTGVSQVAAGDHGHSIGVTLSDLDCANGQVPRYDGAAWSCMAIDSIMDSFTGRVGVGTAGPGAHLVVNGSVRVGAAGGACDASRAGSMAYSSATGELEVCLGSRSLRWRAGPRTCKEILAATPSAANGVYDVYPSWLGGAALPVYCNMSDGGWTLLGRTVNIGLTAAQRDTIRLGGWVTYAQTGYGAPDAASRVYWMPLRHWAGFTADFPNNQFREVDTVNDLRMEDLVIEPTLYAISWSGPVATYGEILAGAIKDHAFTTATTDNDAHVTINCATGNVGANGGFWYTNCYQSSMLHNNGSVYSWRTNVAEVVTSLELYFREE